MTGWQEESHCSPKTTLLLICGSLKITKTNHKAAEKMFGRTKLNFLVCMRSAVLRKRMKTLPNTEPLHLWNMAVVVSWFGQDLLTLCHH